MTSRTRSRLWLGMGLGGLVLLAGCSGGAKGRLPMAKVKGTVTYQGAPVPDATVTFIMEGAPRTSFGMTNASGHFILTTYDNEDGAFVGTQKVTVAKLAKQTGKPTSQWTPADLAKNGPPKEDKTEGIPAKYADVKTTPLQFTIEAGQNDKSIELRAD